MRFFAVHDTAGNIARIVGCPDGAPPTLPTSMEPGQAVAQIELPDTIAVSSERDLLADLADLAQNYRVDVGRGTSARIARKDEPAGE
ncbi:hypothetical protein [Actinophytocola sp. KF-1]